MLVTKCSGETLSVMALVPIVRVMFYHIGC